MIYHMISQQDNDAFEYDNGLRGLPPGYPVPDVVDMLFYIQRNMNTDTVIYQLNRNASGQLDLDCPIYAYWMSFGEEIRTHELNYIQNTLAFGYHSKYISNDLFEIQFVSYKKKKFFLARKNENEFGLVTELRGIKSYLNHIYVYAEEFGVFPDVKFIELFGEDIESGKKVYERDYINA